jgi:hypothetical protein
MADVRHGWPLFANRAALKHDSAGFGIQDQHSPIETSARRAVQA